jgi:hypothetical protein
VSGSPIWRDLIRGVCWLDSRDDLRRRVSLANHVLGRAVLGCTGLAHGDEVVRPTCFGRTTFSLRLNSNKRNWSGSLSVVAYCGKERSLLIIRNGASGGTTGVNVGQVEPLLTTEVWSLARCQTRIGSSDWRHCCGRSRCDGIGRGWCGRCEVMMGSVVITSDGGLVMMMTTVPRG